MCGRFNVTSDPLQAVFMDLVGQNYPGTDNFNVAPTSNVWIITENPGVRDYFHTVNARWWLTPSWAKEISTKYSMFNARSENLEKSPAFKIPFKRKRCVVPISGYYEWRKLGEGKKPYYVRRTTPYPLTLAGLWDEWHNPNDDEVVTSFTIVTCAAVESLKSLHHRQPVILGQGSIATWLRASTEISELQPLVRPQLPHEIELVPVSNYVGNTRNNGPKCVEPTGPSQHVPSEL